MTYRERESTAGRVAREDDLFGRNGRMSSGPVLWRVDEEQV
jgi:hypothetical protein